MSDVDIEEPWLRRLADEDIPPEEPRPRFTQPTANVSFGDDDDLPPEGGYPCDICGKVLTTQSGMRKHRTKIHGRDGESPPRFSAAPRFRQRAAPSPPPSARRDRLHDSAEAFTLFVYDMGGDVWSMFDPVCGKAWKECRAGATDAWYEGARKNKVIRRMIESTENVGVVGLILGAHVPVVEAVYHHHAVPMIERARRRGEEEVIYEPEPEQPATAFDGSPVWPPPS